MCDAPIWFSKGSIAAMVSLFNLSLGGWQGFPPRTRKVPLELFLWSKQLEPMSGISHRPVAGSCEMLWRVLLTRRIRIVSRAWYTRLLQDWEYNGLVVRKVPWSSFIM